MSEDFIQSDGEQWEIEALLEHVRRYRLTTFAVLLQQLEFKELGAHRLRQILKTASDLGVIASATLHSGVRYWFLTGDGAEYMKLDRFRSGTLSEEAKIRAYSLLLFCCGSNKPRYRLEPNEIRERFASLGRPGMPSTYCFDPSGLGCLSLVRVDAGQTGRWDRIVASLKLDIARHLMLPVCQQLISARRFKFTILTVLPRKAERLSDSFKTLAELKRVQIEVIAQPQLLPLITSKHGKENQSQIPRHGFHRSPSRSK